MTNESYDKLTSMAIDMRIKCQNFDKHLESIGDLSFRNNLEAIVMQTAAIIRKAEEMKSAAKES